MSPHRRRHRSDPAQHDRREGAAAAARAAGRQGHPVQGRAQIARVQGTRSGAVGTLDDLVVACCHGLRRDTRRSSVSRRGEGVSGRARADAAVERARPELDLHHRSRQGTGARAALPRLATHQVRARVGRHHVAQGVRRARRHLDPGRHLQAGRSQGDRGVGRVRRRHRHGGPDADRARHRRTERALPAPDAAGRRGVVPAVLRAGRRL